MGVGIRIRVAGIGGIEVEGMRGRYGEGGVEVEVAAELEVENQLFSSRGVAA